MHYFWYEHGIFIIDDLSQRKFYVFKTIVQFYDNDPVN